MDGCGPIALAMLMRVDVPVVRGVVTEVVTVARDRNLWTTYVIAVEERLRGEIGDVVQIVLPGGALGEVVQRAHGWPLWRAGDDVISFVPAGGRVPAHAAWRIEGDGRLDQDLWLVDVEERLTSAR